MPGLSARFSMLRAQDDPTSKIGKASDDSVLFPKRASRLELFNHNGLTDIGELDSLRGSIRPPFAFRTDSYSTDGGYGTDEDGFKSGSIMSRAKPGEGNTMFGGRQKIYKIPVDGSSRRHENEDGRSNPPRGMGGKFLYESDIAMSQFQKMRLQEKEERERVADERPSTRSSKEDERSTSPPPSQYNMNRETTSSTTSGPSHPRTSTAATSVASQRSLYGGPANANGSATSMTSANAGAHNLPNSERPLQKNKKLYEQGLDQHMHEQQHSAINRLESLHRQRTIDPPLPRNLHQSRSATNLNGRSQRNGPLYTSNDFRAGSPPPSASPPHMEEFDLGLNGDASTNSFEKNEPGYRRSPPLSPPMSPSTDATFAASLEPNDLGKATASGAFNKPKRQYNEQQYLQRQLQLQQGRETPSPVKLKAPSIDKHINGRSRNDSVNSTYSANGSVRRNMDNYNPDQSLNTVRENPDRPSDKPKDPNHPAVNTSFFSGFSSSEASPQTDNEPVTDSPITGLSYQSLSQAATKVPTKSNSLAPEQNRYHPSRLSPKSNSITDETASETLSQRTITQSHNSSIHKAKPANLNADSPTLGPTTTGNGLSGLVRAHLRNDSGQSSVYPEQSPTKFPTEKYSHHHRESSLQQAQTFFNPDAVSDDEQATGIEDLPKPEQTDAMPPPLAITARNFLEQATALKTHEPPKAKQTLGIDKAQRVLGREAPRSSQESPPAPSWQEQLKAHHARGGSTETEKERVAFASELAERRRAVQDNLKTFVENESPNPAPGLRQRDPSPAGKPQMPFGILRNKNSKGSLASKSENPTKAMKMLGIAPGTNLGSRPTADNFPPDESEQRTRYMNDGQRAQMQPRQRSKPPSQRSSPPLSKSSRANRSSSDLSEKRPDSRKSRSGEAKPPANREPLSIQSNQPLNYTNGPPRPVEELMASISRHQTPNERSQPQASGRLRSNSRANASGYFEQRGPPSAPASVHGQVGLSPRPSPIAATHSTHSVPSLRDHPSNYSNATSPVMISKRHSPTFNRSHPAYRKGSINKHDISEPRFISCTSSVTTIDLPPEASLKNGMDDVSSDPPPVPPFNPRRKRTRTLLGHLGRTEKHELSSVSSPTHNDYQERSTFSADESDPKPRIHRHKLRKSSSEGGNLAARARQQATAAPSPAVPHFAQNAAPNPDLNQYQYDASAEPSPAMRQYGFEGSAASSPVMRQYPHSPAMPRFQGQGEIQPPATMF